MVADEGFQLVFRPLSFRSHVLRSASHRGRKHSLAGTIRMNGSTWKQNLVEASRIVKG